MNWHQTWMALEMFNNSHASHLHFLSTLEVLFLQFMMNKKDSIAGTVLSDDILWLYLYFWRKKNAHEAEIRDAKSQFSYETIMVRLGQKPTFSLIFQKNIIQM